MAVSVVVGDVNIAGVPVIPAEDDATLSVDADAPCSFEVSGEGFEAVGRWLCELVDVGSAVDLAELHECSWLNVAGEFTGIYTTKDF
jgi:hypothetical protein